MLKPLEHQLNVDQMLSIRVAVNQDVVEKYNDKFAQTRG
jgi:hypothetical protein